MNFTESSICTPSHIPNNIKNNKTISLYYVYIAYTNDIARIL